MKTSESRRTKRNCKRILTALGMGLLLAALPSQAAPGDLLAHVNLPVGGFGVSVGVDCDGNIYYTQGDQNLYKMNKNGTLLATIPIKDSVTGAGLTMDEMAWDNGRKLFWIQQHGSNPVRVYKLDPGTGTATLGFVSSTISVGTFRDGIAYDASDDSIWISGDVSTTIEHYLACNGARIGQITPKNSSGGALGDISGVQTGVGDSLYLGQDGLVQIVRVRKSDGGFIGSFASPGGTRDEGLECDAVNFAPKLVLWSRDVNNFLAAIEIEPGTCACQSACPASITTCNDAGKCGAVVTYSSGSANTTCSPASGSFFPVGTTTVTCTTTNALCPDIPPTHCSFTITVNDCEPPRLSCSDVTQCNDQGQCSAVVNYQVNASDNCPGVLVVCNPPPGSTFSKGSTHVSCTATDSAGQTTSCGFNVIVNDCEPPTLNCGDITVCNDPGQCSAVVADYNVSASDNCPGVTFVCTPPEGTTFPKGINPVTCVATDSSSNITSCTFNVTVNDCEAPVAGCRESLNPSGKKIPVAGKNPKSGQNPDGFYELLGKDNCDASSALSVFLIDGDTGFVFGPFAVGTIVKITQSNHDTIQPMAGVVSWHIQLVGDAFVYVVDSSGNVGSSTACFVPPPPK